MLFIPPGKSEPWRLQGAFIPNEDTERLMQWYRDERDAKRKAYEAQGLVLEEPVEAEARHSRPCDSVSARRAGRGEERRSATGKALREARGRAHHQPGSTSRLPPTEAATDERPISASSTRRNYGTARWLQAGMCLEASRPRPDLRTR